MNRNVIILGIVILAVSFGALSAGAAENLQPRDEVLKTLIKVNDHYLRKHPDPLLGIPYYSRKKVYEANIWTDGSPFHISCKQVL